jgi:hypothetical protein
MVLNPTAGANTGSLANQWTTIREQFTLLLKGYSRQRA